ncbi:MAG: riboflavin kinase [Lentimicrobiaceae bacterium]|nr:riboflavin kinase [Lentimicrobiaceae bacterium]
MYKKFLGTVVHGLGKGKDLGFPTVNIELNNNDSNLEKGVYAVFVTVDNQVFKGMLYVGTRPTFDLQEVSIEIHILDFDQNIYDAQIDFQILHKTRDEIKFSGTEQLIEQLHRDREIVYNYFQNLDD